MLNEKLAAAAHEALENNPETAGVLVCEDGNIFILEGRSYALHHCRINKLPAPVEVMREPAAITDEELMQEIGVVAHHVIGKSDEISGDEGTTAPAETEATPPAAPQPAEEAEPAKDEVKESKGGKKKGGK